MLKLILNSKLRQLFKISKDKDISPFVSLHGRHSKGKRKEIWVRDRVQGRREEGIACKVAIIFAIHAARYVCKNNTTVNV